MTIEKRKETPEIEHNLNKDFHHLILINDDIHTFDYVIDALIEVCKHTKVQATQCTMLVHYKGRCDVKKGSLKDLKQLRKALIERELTAIIN
jgi:ATP-dependent Clp protease adaptor protein ClpS